MTKRGFLSVTKRYALINKIYSLMKKELILEFRSHMLVLNILIFALASNLLIYYFFNSVTAGLNVYMSVYWIIIIFMIFTGFDNMFRLEHEKKNLNFLVFHYDVSLVLISKVLFNLLLLLAGQSIFTFIFFIFNDINFERPGLFVLYAFIGSAVLNISTVCTALISCRARNRFLFFIISAPVMFPLVIALSKTGEILLLDKALDLRKIMFMVFYAVFYFMLALLFAEKILIEE